MNNILQYESDEEPFIIDDVVLECSLRMRARGKEYRLISSLKNEKEIEIDECWEKNVLHNTEKGFKQFFYCNIDNKNCKKSLSFI